MKLIRNSLPLVLCLLLVLCAAPTARAEGDAVLRLYDAEGTLVMSCETADENSLYDAITTAGDGWTLVIGDWIDLYRDARLGDGVHLLVQGAEYIGFLPFEMLDEGLSRQIILGETSVLTADYALGLGSFRGETNAYPVLEEEVDGLYRYRLDVPLPERLPGDCSGDGRIDGRDFVRLLKYLAGQNVELDLRNAEVTGDGLVDGRDALRLMQHLCGLPAELL